MFQLLCSFYSRNILYISKMSSTKSLIFELNFTMFSTLFYYTESLMYIRNLWLFTHDFWFKNENIKLNTLIILSILYLSIDQISARDFTHVFLSKGVYETCEDLWFKCLVLEDSTFRLSDKAHTAFVEVVNPNDSVVWKEKYPIVNGECDGQIYIGDDWKTGEYRMYVSTRNTLGSTDSVMFPTRILIVKELPEVQDLVSTWSK